MSNSNDKTERYIKGGGVYINMVIEAVIKGYKKECEICNRIIVGTNKNEVNYNFKLHHQSCKKKTKEALQVSQAKMLKKSGEVIKK